MGSIQEKINYLKNAKEAMRSAIMAKGVVVSETEPLRNYADKIDSIKGTTHTTPTNTYKAGTIEGKFAYLADTKEAIRRAIVAAGVSVSETEPIGRYASKIRLIESPTISFTIGDVAYTANNNMTWEQWVNSDYNIDNAFIIDGNGEVNKNGTNNYVAYRKTPDSDYTFVTSGDIIVAQEYSLRK